MGMQRELFESKQTKWVQTVWSSIPIAVRQEICDILARMGHEAVDGNKRAKGGKEVSDE
jgi:hypothetical protein